MPVNAPWATERGTQKARTGTDSGAECYSVEDATVEDVGYGDDLGKWVTISFTKGHKKCGVAYAHLSEGCVKKGAKVRLASCSFN